MRLIDSDAFIEEARERIDMQDMYLPVHIKELVIDEMPTINRSDSKHLIDADALVKDLCENYVFFGFPELLADFGTAIKAQPTVDAVPVIRCKDCVHKSEYGYCTLYINFHHLTEDMGYCSDAERKEA